LYYKQDWEKSRERYLAWWHGEAVDRCGLKIVVRNRDYVPKELTKPETQEAYYTDPDWVIPSYEERFKRTHYIAEAFPSLIVNLGPASIASYLGTTPVFNHDTVWQEHSVTDWDEFLAMEPDWENEWWKKTVALTEAACEAGCDKFFVTIADIGGPTDILSHLRGNAELCMDMVEQPDKVKAARDKVADLWYKYYDKLHNIIQRTHKGSTAWINLWSPGRCYALQCDYSCLISPEMFEEFVLPELDAQAKWLDHTIYHLDGPDAIKHLDAVLSLPDLHAVQWVPGAGQPGHDAWIPLLKKCQDAGKSIIVYGPAEWLELMLTELSPRGLMFETKASSIEHAQEMIKMAEKLSSDRGRTQRKSL
jgi:hypothetical protein